MGYICVFDCETVPDAEDLRKVYGYEGSDLEVGVAAQKAQSQKSGSDFLPVCFHKVVAISAVLADEKGKFLRVSTMEGRDEKERISKFLAFLNTHNPRLVSFNGRCFDLPMLLVRAMKYNLAASAYFETSNKQLGKDKWCNYQTRGGEFHLDLLDHISSFRAVSGLGLDALCSVVNLPGKLDTTGDQVAAIHASGDMARINAYCESDVLNTYWLFLKFEILRGNLNLEDYAGHLIEMGKFLSKMETDYSQIFCAYIKNELNRIR